MNSKILLLLILTFVTSGIFTHTINAQAILKERDTIPLSNIRGDIKQLDFDTEKTHLFITSFGNNTVEVMDLKSKKIVKSIRKLKSPQGIAFVPKSSYLYISQLDDGSVRIIDTVDYSTVSIIDFKYNADRLVYLPSVDRLLVAEGSGGIAIIDTTTNTVTNMISLGGHPEGMQANEDGTRIYANIPSLNSIEVTNQKRKLERWETHSSYTNFPMAIDNTHNIIAIANRTNNPNIILFDNKGTKLHAAQTSNNIEELLFISSGLNTFLIGIARKDTTAGQGKERSQITVWRVDTSSYSLQVVQRVFTSPNASSILFVKELRTLFVAAPQYNNQEAHIKIFSVR